MKCVFKDATLAKKIISAISTDISLINFEFSPDGLKLQAVNNGHTDMRELVLCSNFFAEYECVEDIVLGLNMDLVQKFMNMAGTNDVVTWSSNGNSFGIVVDDIKNGYPTCISMSLVDIDQDQLNIPTDVEWDVHIRVASTLFRQWITRSKLLEGTFDLCIGRESIRIEISDDLSNSISMEQRVPALMANIVASSPTFLNISKKISSKEIDVMGDLIKCAPGIDIQYGKDKETGIEMPVCCMSHFGEGSYIRLWIATMIEDDE